MKRKRFTEEQIIGVLKEAEAGAKTVDRPQRQCFPSPATPGPANAADYKEIMQARRSSRR